MARTVCAALVLIGCAIAAGGDVFAASPSDIQRSLEAEARQSSSGFTGLSAQRGEQFCNAGHGGDGSCATRHTSDPRQPGRHAMTGKPITPLAPAANPDRFTNPARVEKWFGRNCNDVLRRPCTATEKGDVLTWLLSLGR